MADVRNRLRVLIVVTLIVLAWGWSAADLRRVFGFPLGEFGFNSDGSIVTSVDPEGAAAAAGIHVGDRISVGDSSPLSRYAVVRGISEYAGGRLTGTVTQGNRVRRILLVSQPESRSERAFIALRFALAFLTAGVATALLLTRPDAATWGFFLYCLTVITLPGAVLGYVVSWQTRTFFLALEAPLQNASFAGGVLFAMMFAHQSWATWRRVFFGVIIIAALTATAIEVYGAYAGARANLIPRTQDVYYGVILLAMLVGFVDSYRHDTGGSRQRLRWMIAALLISAPAGYAAGWFFPGPLTYQEYVGLIAIQAVLPLTAAYAMFRKRVVDVNFVISRTLVIGVLTALLVAIFSFLDAVLSRAFAETRVSLSIDITVALLLGFSLNAAHRRVDNVIDRVLFRERHKAEQRLEHSAAGIIHATDENTITSTLVRLPVEVLSLTGSALYRSGKNGFARAAGAGQLMQLPESVDRNDGLVLYLQAELKSARLDDFPLSSIGGSKGAAAAVLAIPITMRGELAGFVVYGPHSNGADLDPDEERALMPLAKNAAVAYDHLEAESLRARVAVLEAMVYRVVN